jgi:carbamoyl-phosphate synthase large subunit
MKSVGEVMAIGRTFKEALWKGMRSLETGRAFGSEKLDKSLISQKLITPTPDRLNYIRFALASGMPVEQIHEMTAIDPWFLKQMEEAVSFEAELGRSAMTAASPETFRRAKRYGISDAQLAKTWGATEIAVRNRRKELGVHAVFSRVDTCAAEFESFTPYLYSCYESSCEAEPGERKKVMILGSGPNRIGQGIEFDYCCCHASYALQDLGFESIMVNCNPETVSTDYDTSDRLYFEPLTLEHVLNIFDAERPDGVIVQFGGQTPLTLALPLQRLGVPIIGTDPVSIDLAEDRKLFGKLLDELGIPAPANGTATSVEEACDVARRLGYPVLVRPSYVLGGRAMVIAYDEEMVRQYMREAVTFSQDRPVLIDRFLEDATEVDVDALCDGNDVLIAGIMEHIEEAGVHSGDSSCVLPPQSLSAQTIRAIEDYTVRLARALNVVGLMNAQYAIQNGVVYVLEVNPRASRTAPYVSKATGVPLPKIAVGLMLGAKLRDYARLTADRGAPSGVGTLTAPQDFVKSPVFPFNKFPGVDPALGPEMRSTGEVMGVGINFGEAFLKAQIGAGSPLPEKGTVFISVNDHHKVEAVPVARRFADLGFSLVATRGTAAALRAAGLSCKTVFKVNEGRPNVVDLLKGGSIQLAIYTTVGAPAFHDEKAIRRSAVACRVPCITTMSGARAAADAVAARRRDPIRVWSLQEIHEPRKTAV